MSSFRHSLELSDLAHHHRATEPLLSLAGAGDRAVPCRRSASVSPEPSLGDLQTTQASRAHPHQCVPSEPRGASALRAAGEAPLPCSPRAPFTTMSGGAPRSRMDSIRAPNASRNARRRPMDLPERPGGGGSPLGMRACCLQLCRPEPLEQPLQHLR
jgi:hypothetical protein